jgi:diguanylate cyclase (GGDEF)-like protein/PAS domain S-box-containing protein
MRDGGVHPILKTESSILGDRLFESIFESPSNGMILLDSGFHILRVGQAVCDLLGYQQHELFGKLFRMLLRAEDWEAAKARLSGLVANPQVAYEAENCFTSKSGKVEWVIVSVSALAHTIERAMPAYVLHVTSIAKQKQAELKAAEAVSQWSFALDSAGQGLWDCDVPTDTWTYSPMWKIMRGIPQDEEIALDDENWLKEVHPDDHALVLEKMSDRHRQGMGEVAYEYRQRHRDGHWMWVLARGKCIEFTSEGHPKRVIGTDTDITAIKNTEAELKQLAELEMRWKIAVESAEQGLWDINLKKGERFHSGTWKQLRGLQETESLTEQAWLQRIHPDDLPIVREQIRQQGAGETDVVDMEYREKHSDGHWMTVMSRGRVVERDSKNNILRAIGTDIDITAIKQREVELGNLSQSLELALSTSQVGIWKYDVAKKQTFWDRRSQEMFGLVYQEGPLAPNTWENLVHSDDFAYATDVCRVNIAARQDFSLDYRIVLPNGQTRYIRCRASFPESQQNNDLVIGVMWDVTADIEKAEAFKMAKQLAENRTVDLEVARNHLEHASLHDALTGLPNRRHLDMALNKFHLGSKQGQSLTLLHVDLDRFKQINDTKGHAAGDAVLVQISSMLRNQFRGSDLVARIGGDEFVVLLSPSPDRRILQQMVDRVISLSRQPIMWQGHECRCGVSIGIAESVGNIDPKQLFVNADIALYRAKNSGRNCAVFFTGGLQAEVIANKQCADDLLKATERQEFLPFYQPIINAKSFDIAGVEALVRWQHPTRGLLGPDKFLHVAEELNTLDVIDKQILEYALADLKTWQAEGLMIPKISVNVSANRLGSAVLLESLKSLDIEPGRVSFELLESIFLDEDDDANAKNIAAIKEMGIGIDIDDFGTGHASIVSLLRLSPNRMKIDRQLIRNISESEAQRKLVHSIIDIGKSQDIEVCAEGVETLEQARILASLGCDYLQGYYFAKPMSGQHLVSFAKAQSWRSNAPAFSQGNLGVRALTGILRKMTLARTS